MVCIVAHNDKAAASMLYPWIETTNDTLSEIGIIPMNEHSSRGINEQKCLKIFFRQVN